MTDGVSKSGSVNQLASESARTQQQQHTVRPGESLWKIAEQYGLRVEQLLAHNPQFDPRLNDGVQPIPGQDGPLRDPDFIRVGEAITLPEGARKVAAEPKQSIQPLPEDTDSVAQKPEATTTKEQKPVTAPQQALSPDAAKGAETPADVEPEPDAKAMGKIFGFLKGLFENVYFKAALAVVAALPGIGQVVSAAAAIMGLNSIIKDVRNKDGPKFDLTEIAATSLFIAGTFIPGFGGLGGLLSLAGSLPSRSRRGHRTQDVAQAEPQPRAPLPMERTASVNA